MTLAKMDLELLHWWIGPQQTKANHLRWLASELFRLLFGSSGSTDDLHSVVLFDWSAISNCNTTLFLSPLRYGTGQAISTEKAA